MPPPVRELPYGWVYAGPVEWIHAQRYENRHYGLRVLVSLDPVRSRHEAESSLRWHLSVSCPRRVPTWAQVREARDLFVPKDVAMAMILPRDGQYVNLHEYTLHLWETRDLAEDVGNDG
jgi:hypothetical protein